MSVVDEGPVTAAVDLSATGGLDALGNWHDTDGKFAKKGVSTAKAIAVKVIRGVAAAAMAKDHRDGVDLDLHPDVSPKLAAKLGTRPRVRWHSDRFGEVDIPDGRGGTRKIRVPWDSFTDPVPAGHDRVRVPTVPRPDRNDMPEAPAGRPWHADGPDPVTPNAGDRAVAVTPNGDVIRTTYRGVNDRGMHQVDSRNGTGTLLADTRFYVTEDDAREAAHRAVFDTSTVDDFQRPSDPGGGWKSYIVETRRRTTNPSTAVWDEADHLDRAYEGNTVAIRARTPAEAVAKARGDSGAWPTGYVREWGADGPPEYVPPVSADGTIIDPVTGRHVNPPGERPTLGDDLPFVPPDKKDVKFGTSYGDTIAKVNGREVAEQVQKTDDGYVASALLGRVEGRGKTRYDAVVDVMRQRWERDAPKRAEQRQAAWEAHTARWEQADAAYRAAAAAAGIDVAEPDNVPDTNNLPARPDSLGHAMDAAAITTDRIAVEAKAAERVAEAITDDEAAAFVASQKLHMRSDAPTGAELRQRAAGAIISAWAGSATQTPVSAAMHKVVADKFGLAADPSLWETDETQRVLDVSGPMLAHVADRMYDDTQAWFASNGITDVTVYRAVDADSSVGRGNALSSFTADRGLAERYAARYTNGEVVELTVPVSEVFSTPFTGLGTITEREVVVLGHDRDDVPDPLDGTPDGPDTNDLGELAAWDRPPGDKAPWLNDAPPFPTERTTIGNVTFIPAARDADGNPIPPGRHPELPAAWDPVLVFGGWGSHNNLPDRAAVLDRPAPAVSPEHETAVETAIDELFDIHHTDTGINGVDLPTLPTVLNGERFRHTPMSPDTQRVAVDRMFRPVDVPDGHPYFRPPTVIDDTPATVGQPIRAVAVNVDTGEIVGTHAPWDPTPNGVPPYGRWVSLPADHPAAPQLLTAGWLAQPGTKRYLTDDLYPRLRHGIEPDTVYPALTESVRAHADEILAPYRGDTGINVVRVTDPDGTFYRPDPDGPFTVDGDSFRFADFDPDGGLRLWVHPDAVTVPPPPDVYADIDYADVYDDTLPWEDRVAALAQARSRLAEQFARPSDLFTQPTEADMERLVTGDGTEPEFAHLAAAARFGEALETLVSARRAANATQGPSVDKRAVTDHLRSLPGVPGGLVDLLDRVDWDASIVDARGPQRGAPNGTGRVHITFPGQPDSGITVFTPLTGDTMVAWEISGEHQRTLGPDTLNIEPSGMARPPVDLTPGDWYARLRLTDRRAAGENTPEMAAWLDTMEALGIDMSTDDTIYIGTGRDRLAEQAGDPKRGANPTRLADLPDGELALTVDVGLRPYPRSWTSTLGRKLTRVAIDPERDRPVGMFDDWYYGDVSVVDIPSIANNPEFVDCATHEFAHAFERGVDSLMLIETWHFIQRLRREAQVRERLARWQWDDRFYGYRDEFGDEYMGRVYRNPRTGVEGVTAMNGLEIFSTASQSLWAPGPARADPTLDPEARRLFMGLLALLEPPPPEKWKP